MTLDNVSGSISVFQEEYKYWRSQGHSHVVAKNKAIDYYRKFTSREVTEDWELIADSQMQHEDTHEDNIQFNQIVSSVLEDLTERQKEAFCWTIIQQDLDQYLEDDLKHVVYHYTKFERDSDRPVGVRDIAKKMGLAVNAKSICPPMTALKQRIRKTFENRGFTLENMVYA